VLCVACSGICSYGSCQVGGVILTSPTKYHTNDVYVNRGVWLNKFEALLEAGESHKRV